MTDDFEWWVLIDPKNNKWKRVSEEKAKKYTIVQCRYKYALTLKAFKDLYSKS